MAKGVFCVLVNRFLVCLLLISSVVSFAACFHQSRQKLICVYEDKAADIMLKVVACARILRYDTGG